MKRVKRALEERRWNERMTKSELTAECGLDTYIVIGTTIWFVLQMLVSNLHAEFPSRRADYIPLTSWHPIPSYASDRIIGIDDKSILLPHASRPELPSECPAQIGRALGSVEATLFPR